MNHPPVLITGAAGFIGSRLVEAANQRGIPVISVDRPEAFGANPEHAGFDFGQTLDMEELSGWLRSEKRGLHAILHMGASADTTVSDLEFLDRVNLRYTQDLWAWCTEHKVPLVYASSAATYGDGAQGYADDESSVDALRPLNAYGQSKHDFDIWALEQETLGATPPAWSGWKFFNVYGYGERHKGNMASVVLKAFDQIRATGTVKLFKSHHPDYGDGEQSRDFVFVDDVVRVLMFAMDRPIDRGIYNLGTGQARSFKDLVLATYAAMGREPSIEYVDTPVEIRDKYQYFTQADMHKLRETGYDEPFHSLEEGVRAYVERLAAAAPANPG